MGVTLSEFIEILSAAPERIAVAEVEGLTHAAEMLRDEAKSYIGEYQEAAGPFEAWPELSGATLEGFHLPSGRYIPGKEELGYAPPDNPLLREGTLRDSIEYQVEGREAAVGSNDQIAVYQEVGTPNARYPIPPRPFLGRAAFVKGADAVAAIAARVFAAFLPD